MPLSLINKKIIISGGASGIGWSTAKICLSRGAIVYICDIDSKSLKKAQKHPLNKKKLFTYECDASDEYEVSNFFSKIKKKTKKIDALINNVGVAGPTGNIEDLSSDDWEQTLKRIGLKMSLILPTTLIPLDDLPILLGEIEKQETTPIKILIERLPVYDSIKLLRTIAWLAKIGICRYIP